MRVSAAVGRVIWGVAVVGMLDNGVKKYVPQCHADLHPLRAFISVSGALQFLGLWGIFIGPIVAPCLFALIQIFNEELRALAKEREAAAVGAEPSAALTTATVQPVFAMTDVPETSASPKATPIATTRPAKTQTLIAPTRSRPLELLVQAAIRPLEFRIYPVLPVLCRLENGRSEETTRQDKS